MSFLWCFKRIPYTRYISCIQPTSNIGDLSSVFARCTPLLNILKTVFLISYIVYVCDNRFWMLATDTTVQDKLSLFYLCSSRFIVPAKALYHWGQCFPSIRGESSMNKDEHWHKSSPSSFLFYSYLSSSPSSLSFSLSLFFPLIPAPNRDNV